MKTSQNLRLAFVLWFSRLLLALPVTAAFFMWWTFSLRYYKGADELLKRLDVGVLVDMAEDNSTSVWGLMFVVLLASALVGMIVNSLLAGGTFEILIKRAEPHSFSHVFFRGAGHFFWRNLGVLMLTILAATATASIVVGGLYFALKPLENSLFASVSWIRLLLLMLTGGLLVLFFFVFLLDYARIDFVLSGRVCPFRAFGHGFKMAWRRFWVTLRIWFFIGCGLVLLVGVSVLMRKMVSEYNWPLIILVFFLQQLIFFAAAFLRVLGLSAIVKVATDDTGKD